MSAHHWIRPKTRECILRGVPPRWLVCHSRRWYATQAILATPPWVSRADLMALAALRTMITLSTRQVHVLDHIVPLNHPHVCGLNVPWNIAVVPGVRNARKGNYWQPNQLELFADAAL